MSAVNLARRTWSALRRILLRHDHFAPHAYAGFEGHYSRTQLDDGGTLAVIFCWVKRASTRPNLVHVSYTPPPSGSSLPAFKHEFFPDHIEIPTYEKLADGRQPFAVHMPDVGTMEVKADSVEYTVRTKDPELYLNLRISDRIPWSDDTPLAGPMGVLALMSRLLPLNWHVWCTDSKAAYTLSYAGKTHTGTGASHVEKNWGTSFPPGWIWSQSFSSTELKKSLCLAGGAALPGVQAYLIGYRSASLHWDFRPPFSMGLWKLSPFMTVKRDSRTGIFHLTVQTFLRKLVIRASAPPDSFMGLAAPYADGHRPMYALESFVGRTWVEAWGRAYPWQRWTLLEEGECGVTAGGTSCSALEFGGTFSHLVEEHARKTE